MLKFKKQTYISIARNEALNKEESIGEIRRNMGSGASVKTENNAPSVPEGLFIKCGNCGEAVYADDVEENNHTCPK